MNKKRVSHSNTTSQHEQDQDEPEIGWFVAFCTYLSYAIIILVSFSRI